MSDTSKVLSEVKLPSEALSCPLCDTHYDLSSHQPKILPCFHTFCGECLDKELSKGDTLSCPNCRRVTPVPPGRARGFSSNFALMTLLGQVPEVTGGTINCDICAEPAGFRCVECEQFMCEEDKKRHLKFAMSRDHHVEPLSADQIAASSSVPAICSTHNLEMRYLCTKDDTVICTDCFAYSHHGHPCLPIGEAFEAEQGQIAKLVEDATAKANKYRSAAEEVDSTIKAVTEVERRVESEIRLHFEKVRDAVTARELKLLSILQTITKQKETTLTEQREILSSTDVSISTSCAQIQELLKQNSKASCLMMKRQALANLEAIAKVNTPCDPEVTADVHFIADEKLPLMISGTGLVSEVSTSPSHTHATGDGILAGRPNQLMTIEVFAKDSKGKPREVGGDIFIIEAKDYKLESKVIDKKDGSYIATFTCPEDVKEELLVSILLRGKHISGSPFHVHIFKEIEGKFVRKWGSYGVSDGQLNGPIAIAVDKNFVYVSDHCNDQIQIFTREGVLVRKLGGKGSSNGEFAYPWGVQVDDEACVYVADHRNKRIQVFAKDGAFLRAWPTEGTCAGIGIHGGFLYVGENSNHQIHVYTKGGTFVRSWGTSGTEDGQFASPYAVTVDDLYVYVGDRDNHRVQVFTKDGSFVRKWGSYGTGDGLFNGPIGIVVDGEFVYVSDQNHRVQVFNKEGKFVRKWGTGGAGDGQFLNAFGIAIDQGLAYLADYSNHRIQVFK